MPTAPIFDEPAGTGAVTAEKIALSSAISVADPAPLQGASAVVPSVTFQPSACEPAAAVATRTAAN